MNEESLLASPEEETPVEAETTESASSEEGSEEPSSDIELDDKPIATESGYEFDFSQDGIDLEKDEIYQKMIPTFKEMNLSEDQAKAMVGAYMSKTYKDVEGMTDEEGMVFGKYKDATAAQEAFKKLESENGKLRREKAPTAPDKYDYGFGSDEDMKDIVPEDFDLSEDPLMVAMEPVFRDNNFTQDQVSAATKAWLQFQTTSQTDSKAEIESLGSKATELISGAKSFRDMKDFNADEQAIIENWTTTGSEVQLINKIKTMLGGEKTIPTDATSGVAGKSSTELYSEAFAEKKKAGANFQFNTDAQALYDKKMDEAIAAEEKGH